MLYGVRSGGYGRQWYGLRLGFFRDVLSARLVATYVLAEFKDATVVPVSDREHDRASEQGQ